MPEAGELDDPRLMNYAFLIGYIAIPRLHEATCPYRKNPDKPENGKFIIGHSETGHHHIIDAIGAVVGVMDRPPEGMRVLYAILENPLSLEHLRPYDTHGAQMNDPGVYEFRIAREYDHYAELARQSMD